MDLLLLRLAVAGSVCPFPPPPPRLSSEKMERLWESKRAGVEAEESRGGLGGELITHKARRHERKRQELLALALGVRLGSKGTLLWKPIKLLASCPQIASPLVRRTVLKDTPEKQCSYEKIHNFKVRERLCACCMFEKLLEGRIYRFLLHPFTDCTGSRVDGNMCS